MSKKPIVFLVCTGVGHIRRGYESFTEECFAALKNSEHFQLYLLKGGGIKEKQTFRVPCIQRNSPLGKMLAKVFRTDAYGIEQFSFWLAMWPLLLWYRPKVIYYSDFKLGTWLWQLRRFLKFRYQLLFSNGAPNGPPFTRMDHVQQLLPLYLDQASQAGTAIERQTLLPYAITIQKEKIQAILQNKMSGREKLGLPLDKKIIISVGALNKYHKRMDYVVREFNKLGSSEFFLVILGQFEAESNEIVKLAEELLTEKNFIIKQVNSWQVLEYLCVSDYFILASLSEGLPRVLPEALSAGLLPIVHDYPVTRQTLGEYGIFLDLKQRGQLKTAINQINQKNISRLLLLSFAFDNYSWDSIGKQYEQMIKGLIS